jgi:hypothetical protein
MAEPENPCARSVKMTTVSTNVRNVLAGVFIVRHVLFNGIHPIHCIGLRYVLFMYQCIDFMIFSEMEWFLLRADVLMRSWDDCLPRTPRETMSFSWTSTG